MNSADTGEQPSVIGRAPCLSVTSRRGHPPWW